MSPSKGTFFRAIGKGVLDQTADDHDLPSLTSTIEATARLLVVTPAGLGMSWSTTLETSW